VVRTSREVVYHRTDDVILGGSTPYLRISVDGLKEPQGEGVAVDGHMLHLSSEGRPWNRAGRLVSLRCNLSRWRCTDPWCVVVFRLLADVTVLLHLAFVLFVVLGGLLVVRWPRLAWVHLPSAAWGAWVEFAGWICPLTPLENWLRAQGGGAVYESGFLERYLVPVLYPVSLSRELQAVLGCLVVLVNAAVYWMILRRRLRPRAW
jgi:Protein of Unknown function (DUF2784)